MNADDTRVLVTDFQCPYAPMGESRCPASICDCFIDQFPEDPFGLHPEAFIVLDTTVDGAQ